MPANSSFGMTRPYPASVIVSGTNLGDGRRRAVVEEGRCLLLAEQLRLLDAKKEVRTLRERDGGDHYRREALTNDLVGIRFVLNAALLSQGLDEPKRDEL